MESTVAGTAGPPGAVPSGVEVARRGAAALMVGWGERMAALGWLEGAVVSRAAAAGPEVGCWAGRPDSRTAPRVAEMAAAGWAGWAGLVPPTGVVVVD